MFGIEMAILKVFVGYDFKRFSPLFQHKMAQGWSRLPHPPRQVEHHGDPRVGQGHLQAQGVGLGAGGRRQVRVRGAERIREVALHHRRHYLG